MSVRRLLWASAAAAVIAFTLSSPGKAAIIANLGVNPTSAQGDFSSSPGGGAFEDQFTFQLAGPLPLHISIANVTNVFPAPSDFIANFQASVWNVGPDGIVNNADDVVVIGPVAATLGCGAIANCQFAAGTAILANGSYYLEFTGIGGGTSGYGGNLSTFAVPSPVIGGGLPGLVAAIAGMWGWRRSRRA